MKLMKKVFPYVAVGITAVTAWNCNGTEPVDPLIQLRANVHSTYNKTSDPFKQVFTQTLPENPVMNDTIINGQSVGNSYITMYPNSTALPNIRDFMNACKEYQKAGGR